MEKAGGGVGGEMLERKRWGGGQTLAGKGREPPSMECMMGTRSGIFSHC